jgi:hypothetical protein
MARSSRALLAIAIVALVILGSFDSAQAQRRNRSNRDGSNNETNSNNDNESGGNNNNNNDNDRSNRRNRNRNRDNDGNSDVQQLQQFIQGTQGGQRNQGNPDDGGSLQQRRRRGQQGGRQSGDVQQLRHVVRDGHDHRDNHWHARRFDRHDELRHWVLGFNGGPRPFTNDWYQHHPHAWHHHHHDDGDYWQVATAATVLGWLGWQHHPHHHHTTIVYDPVPVESYLVDGQPSAAVDPEATGDWLTLGAFTLLTGADDPGTRVLQLSIDKHGHVRGSYYDMITNSTQNVYGVIDQNSQHVRWTLETNRKLTFVATLDQLTQSQGVVNVKLPGGQIQQWQLVRMEDAGN